jgi:hypothetical protein
MALYVGWCHYSIDCQKSRGVVVGGGGVTWELTGRTTKGLLGLLKWDPSLFYGRTPESVAFAT